MHFVLVKICFSENRKGISQIYQKIGDFFLFIFVLLNSGIEVQLHLFRLKQGIWGNALLDSVKDMPIEMATTQLLMGLFEKFFHLHDLPGTSSIRTSYFSYLSKGPDRMG